jgi:hypothetical protein
MIKVNYDQTTSLVLGYYPDSVNYDSIPTPSIEIEDNEQDNSKQMCVKDGVYQEFIKPDSELLQEAKDSKISQIKANRKAANQKDLISIQANEITDNGDGSFTATTNLVDFAFRTKSSEDELTSPSNLLNACLRGNTIRYSCEILNPTRKGYVEITPAIAGNIETHLIARGETNVAYANQLEKDVDDCTTIEDINNIDITFS